MSTSMRNLSIVYSRINRTRANRCFARVRLISHVCLLALLLSIAPAQAQSGITCAAEVIVQPGDALSSLATRYYGNLTAYTSIVDATNAKAAVDTSFTAIEDANIIGQGWKLCIPGPINGQSTTGQSAVLATPTPAAIRAATPVAATPAPAATRAVTSPLTISAGITTTPAASGDRHRLSIQGMRQRSYPGSAITIEQTLEPGANYSRYIASYRSEGLKIYALLTVPFGTKPATGWPVIIFNHGYIPPEVYRTTERYIAYVDGFARNGYIVFRSDYRGHGSSEGEANGAYGEPDYVIDVLNALASMKAYPDADPARIGMWGHSLGGYITLRSMVITKDIKVGVIWAGVVASYPDLMSKWRRPSNATPDPTIPQRARRWRQELLEEYGTPEENPTFWASISANSFLADISGPLQLHHGSEDADVPLEFSTILDEQMLSAGKTVEYFTYPGDNHNLSNNLNIAIQRSVEFFDRYLKPVAAQ